MLDPDRVDLEMLAMGLQDQNAYDVLYLIHSGSGEVLPWNRELDPDLDDLDPELIVVEALPSRVWYRDMADFAAQVTDARAAGRLSRALEGKGAFRRFRDEVYRRDDELHTAWNAFRTVRENRRAVGWLLDHDLITEAQATAYDEAHPDPAVP